LTKLITTRNTTTYFFVPLCIFPPVFLGGWEFVARVLRVE